MFGHIISQRITTITLLKKSIVADTVVI